MEGDFTRNSDDPERSYSGVLMQQGRVQLDADWNEQWAIHTRALRGALWDLIGDHGGPENRLGFSLSEQVDESRKRSEINVGAGIYYVDGIRCVERGSTVPAPKSGQQFLAFLDVWERHVNVIEDPATREIALLGPDTASRAEVLTRVRFLEISNSSRQDEGDERYANRLVREQLRDRPRRNMAAMAKTENASDDACKLSPLAQYRGRENQLYRVEIHSGEMGGNASDRDPILFTFKWSRDNGSVVFPVLEVTAPEDRERSRDDDDKVVATVRVTHLGRDERFGLVAGDIVELVHDNLTRGKLDDEPIWFGGPDPGRHGTLGRVVSIDRDELTVEVEFYAPEILNIADAKLHPYLRRWDQKHKPKEELVDGAIPVRVSDIEKWHELEDGVKVRFQGQWDSEPNERRRRDEGPRGSSQRSGDYWLIPARVATGGILWPTDDSEEKEALFLPPHGPTHHYAPLAFYWGSQGNGFQDVRRIFPELAVERAR